jgi:L-seryl-tRNA(Ser) seleniumtransferase
MNYSDIPNVNTLLALPALGNISSVWATEIVRHCTEGVRRQLAKGVITHVWTLEDWNKALTNTLKQHQQLRYRPVINATGIVVHTNLGRAPLAQEVVSYMTAMSQYTDLELRLTDGKRGGRLEGIRQKLCAMTGAEDALVVNNNAAAVLLILSAIAANKEVVVSRGELVEIGGSFRIPDVIQQGGAILREVGCTNRLHLRDIEAVLSTETGAILRVHTSNYRIVGFTSRPDRKDVCALGSRYQVPVVEDLGSGLLVHAPDVPWKDMLEREESIANALAEGVDVVCASGDKLLGGVQAGLIVGRKKWIEKCRQHPLYRALRLDKMMLAGLEATLQMHLEGRSHELPAWEYLERSAEQCKQLALDVADGFEGVDVVSSVSFVGGGALPDQTLDTWAIRISNVDVEKTAHLLRVGEPAIMARVQKNAVWLDVRTVSRSDISDLRTRLREVLA